MMKTAYFAGGCFWCITPAFKEMPGVAEVISGYCGGEEENPAYEDVKHQRTGHRETIRIDYDAAQVSFSQLLEMFLQNVDPFDGEGQFIDRGHSYTLAVYCNDDEERCETLRQLDKLEKDSGRQVFVSVEAYRRFYAAEEEHQDYYLKHPAEFEKELIDSGRKKA